MYAHKVSNFYLQKWANENGKESVYLFDKEKEEYNNKNSSNVFGEGNYYYLKIFIDAPIDNTDGFKSGSQMWMTSVLKDVFPSFFDDLDNNDFKFCTFLKNNKPIAKNKSYELIYYFYSSAEDRVVVLGKSGNKIHHSTLKKMIENKWYSENYREIIENKMSGMEGRFKKIHDDIIDSLETYDVKKLSQLHDAASELFALQHARIPQNFLNKRSVDLILETLNYAAISNGLDYLVTSYTDEDYKDICLVQFLAFFCNFKVKTNGAPSSQGNIFNSYFNTYKQSSFFFVKSTKEHKFVIGDDPIVPVVINNKNYFLALPLSPDFCLFVLGNEENRLDKIVDGTNKIVDFINYLEYKSSTSGVISKDKKFVNKERVLDEKDIKSFFRKIGLLVSEKEKKEL